VSLSVLAVTAGSVKGGVPDISPFVAEQIRALRAEGCDVQLGAIESRVSLTGAFGSVLNFREKVDRHRIQVVHAHYGSMVSMIALAARRSAAYVVSFGGSDLLGVPQSSMHWRVRQNVTYGFSMLSAHKADAVIVKSAALRDALPRRAAGKTVVMPNGVNLVAFSPADQATSRRTLGWNVDEPIVLFNGSLGSNIHVKNHALANETVKHVRRTLGNVRLVMTGNDPPDLIPHMLNAADCLLVTSLHEGSPNIVKEAMACDLPVVSVPCGDVAERLTSQDVGSVCAYDAPALSAALVDYLRARRRSRGRAALIAQKLDSTSVAKNMLTLFDRVVAARG
jgi:teichuronic acid biosynthesis glycosyltransferase TuaC